MLKKKQAFSLVELMIVVMILSVLAIVVGRRVMGSGEQAKVSLAGVSIKGIESDLERFKIQHHRYPTTEEGLEALTKKPDAGDIKNYPKEGYVNNVPNDPWGHALLYLSPGSHGAFDLWSKGADQVDGSEDDIKNWKEE